MIKNATITPAKLKPNTYLGIVAGHSLSRGSRAFQRGYSTTIFRNHFRGYSRRADRH